MRVVVIAMMLVAATSIPAFGAAAPADTGAYGSPEALRRYAKGRLLEEQGRGADALGEYFRALILDPRSTALAMRASELSARLGDHRRSLELADRALRVDPSLARARWLRGGALFHLGESAAALEALEAAVEADSARLEYLQTLARVAEHLDRIDVVNRAYRRAVHLDEFDPEGWFQLAASEARLGRFDTADSALARAAELNPLRPGLAFLQGWIAESLGRTESAVDAYQAHLEAHPSDLTTRGRLLGVLMREERWREAFTQARAISDAQPGDPEALEVLADVAFHAGRASEARDALGLLERIDPDSPAIIGRIVAVYARSGGTREANLTLERWNRGHPGDFRGALAAAQLLSMRGDRALALDYAQRAVRVAPDSLAPRVVIGQIHQAEERWAEAERAWREVLERHPRFDPAAFGLAFCREQLGDLAGAEGAARKVLARDPANADALNFIGYMLADHDTRLEEAERMIARALEQEPDNGAFVDSMGWVYYRLGRLEEARRLLERAAELTGNDPVVREHLGDVYRDLDLEELAREQYRLSLATDGSNERVRRKLRAMGAR